MKRKIGTQQNAFRVRRGYQSGVWLLRRLTQKLVRSVDEDEDEDGHFQM
jgi:hypothetical protein